MLRFVEDFAHAKLKFLSTIFVYQRKPQAKHTVPHVESDASPPRPVQQVNYEIKYVSIVESGASANFSQSSKKSSPFMLNLWCQVVLILFTSSSW